MPIPHKIRTAGRPDPTLPPGRGLSGSPSVESEYDPFGARTAHLHFRRPGLAVDNNWLERGQGHRAVIATAQ